MPETPETRSSLLVRVRDPRDGDAWAEFVAVYEPLIYRVARRRGLQDADAREVTQEVLADVSRAMADWQPTAGEGSFRAWLNRVARNRAINLLVRQARHPRPTGDSNSSRRLEQETGPADERLFDEEYRRQVFRQTAELLRCEFTDSTWKAFWWTSVDGRSVAGVASELRISIGAVYTARSRVLARLKKEIREREEPDEFDLGLSSEAD